MNKPVNILLQTTIPTVEDDWNIDRFSLLRDYLRSIKNDTGASLYKVTTRNRETNAEGNDAVLSVLETTDFDELWLFAVDTGDGLTVADCAGITRFHQRGGGILTTRDHQDLGSSLCTLGGVGRAHFFHTQHLDPDESRQVRDDQRNQMISWPNYHSGANGDYQKIKPRDPVHELLKTPSGMIGYFPAHPHEGSVGLPEGEDRARVIATGISQATDRDFNLMVAFERRTDRQGNRLGRAIAESSFHHFVDYNWDTSSGCPSFLDEGLEPPGDEIKRDPARLEDIKTYVSNLARWLAPSA